MSLLHYDMINITYNGGMFIGWVEESFCYVNSFQHDNRFWSWEVHEIDI